MKEIRFDEFVVLQRGFDLPRQKRGFGEVPVVGAAEIQGVHSQAKVKPPVVTTGRSGTLGRVLLQRVPSWPLNTCLWVKDFKGNDPYYVFYYLQTLGLEQYNSGAGVPTLNRNHLSDLTIKIHDLKQQARIASILSAYDDLIENNTRRIAILEEMARRLYEEWFVYFRFPGHEEVEFKESELGRIPAGWPVKRVAEVFEILGGGTPSKKIIEYWTGGDINWFSPTDLTRSATAFVEESSSKITALGLKKSSAKLFPPYSVMMTSRATIGVVSINTRPASTNQGFITCLPSDEFPLYLLYHWLKDNVETFISLGTGATFKEISKSTFKEIQLAVPPMSMSRAYQEAVDPVMRQVLTLQRKNANLRAQRDLLLPKLVSGEIDVSDLALPDEASSEAA